MEFSLKLWVKSVEKKGGGGGLCFWIKIEGHMKKNQAHQSKIKQHTCRSVTPSAPSISMHLQFLVYVHVHCNPEMHISVHVGEVIDQILSYLSLEKQ